MSSTPPLSGSLYNIPYRPRGCFSSIHVIGDNDLMTVVVEELFTKDFKEGLILN